MSGEMRTVRRAIKQGLVEDYRLSTLCGAPAVEFRVKSIRVRCSLEAGAVFAEPADRPGIPVVGLSFTARRMTRTLERHGFKRLDSDSEAWAELKEAVTR